MTSLVAAALAVSITASPTVPQDSANLQARFESLAEASEGIGHLQLPLLHHWQMRPSPEHGQRMAALPKEKEGLTHHLNMAFHFLKEAPPKGGATYEIPRHAMERTIYYSLVFCHSTDAIVEQTYRRHGIDPALLREAALDSSGVIDLDSPAGQTLLLANAYATTDSFSSLQQDAESGHYHMVLLLMLDRIFEKADSAEAAIAYLVAELGFQYYGMIPKILQDQANGILPKTEGEEVLQNIEPQQRALAFIDSVLVHPDINPPEDAEAGIHASTGRFRDALKEVREVFEKNVLALQAHTR